MSTFSHLYIHIVFGVKGRNRSLLTETRRDLFSYIAGIITKKSCVPIIVNGVEDHVHILTGINPGIKVSDLVRDIKSNSSKWYSLKTGNMFSWQDGYGVFSCSQSSLGATEEYIVNQEEHHKKYSFEDEFIALLKKHNINYDEKYLFN